MPVLAEHLVLGQPQPVDRSHQHAAFPGQVAEDLLLERGLEQVARADGDAERQAAVAGPAGVVLVDRVAGVDPAAFKEQPADGRARAFRGDQDHIDVLRRNNAGLVLIDDAEAVREVQRLALGQVRLDHGPLLLLARVGEEVLDDRSAACCFFEGEERPARLPAVLPGEVPTPPALLAQADDDPHAVVLHVERLPATLHAVAEHRDRFVLEDLPDPLRRIVGTLHHGFFHVAYFDLAHGGDPLRSVGWEGRL